MKENYRYYLTGDGSQTRHNWLVRGSCYHSALPSAYPAEALSGRFEPATFVVGIGTQLAGGHTS